MAAVESAAMQMSRPLLRLTAWITVAAILALLWSGIAHARDVRAAPWDDICSAVGGKTGDSQKTDAHVRHCAFCSKQDMAHALPSCFDQPLPALRHPSAAPAVPGSHPASHVAWLTPHPRGPPSLPA